MGRHLIRKKRQLNRTYFEVFGVVPCMQRFNCTREEYLEALNTAIKTKAEIEKLLPLVGEPIGKGTLIQTELPMLTVILRKELKIGCLIDLLKWIMIRIR